MPENLGNAHKCCRDKLTNAMEDNVDIVIQHNTNVCDWENKELRVKAEALGKEQKSSSRAQETRDHMQCDLFLSRILTNSVVKFCY